MARSPAVLGTACRRGGLGSTDLGSFCSVSLRVCLRLCLSSKEKVAEARQEQSLVEVGLRWLGGALEETPGQECASMAGKCECPYPAASSGWLNDMLLEKDWAFFLSMSCSLLWFCTIVCCTWQLWCTNQAY